MKKVVFSLSVVLTAVAGYAVYLQLEVSRLEQLIAVRDIPEAVGEARVAEATSDAVPASELGESGSQNGTQYVAAAQATGVEVAPPANQENREDRRRDRMERMAAVFEDPQMRADMVERQMTRIDDQYAKFFKTLNLSSEDLDTLRTLMAERSVINWETRMRRFGAEDEAERDAINAERELQRDVLSEEIKALLGKEGTQELKDYSEGLPYRREVDALATSLSYSESPLSEAQSEALVDSMRIASKGFEYTKDLSEMRGPGMRDVSRGDIETYFSERAERDALVLEVASDTLDDAQLSALAERQLAERERDRRQMEFMQQNPPPDRGWGRGPGR